MMRKKTAVAGLTLTLSIAAAASGVAAASNRDDGGTPVTSEQADRATAAALRAMGGGTANSVERDSENGATWEVEVTREDGVTVDVRLDESYRVVVVEADSEE